ncbi:MAG: sigma-70 family RNA polymerase sigma factor [Actinobacteria bacterium]|nr:sigma-70 family RNA polymerase sigma factor [Actinomycetota bacterium]
MEPEILGGDGVQEDFEVFYDREFSQVVGLAYALCGSWPTAEDLAQDAFVSAKRRWSVVGAYEQPGAWVRRAVANRSVSLTRRRVSEAKAMLRLRRQRRVDPPDLDGTDDKFWSEVRRLTPRQRQVISLHYVNDLRVREIAEVLEISEATVKTHLQRARSTLQARLADQRGLRP